MRVVYLSASGELGGAEISLLDILTSIRRAEPDWYLQLIVAQEGPLASKARAAGIPAVVVPFPTALARLGDAGVGGSDSNHLRRLALLYKLLTASAAVGAYIERLRPALVEAAPDLLHTNGFKMHMLGIWARPRPVPVVWHLHDYVSTRPVMARLLRRYASRCAAAVVNSGSVAEDAQSACAGRLKTYTVYNGIDLDRFSPTGPALDLDSLAGLPPAEPGTIKVGLLATFGRWKGHKIFLEALSMLPASLPVRGYVVGGALYQTDGSQYSRDELRRKATQLGISGKVGFTGFVDQSDAAIRALDIVVHASTRPEPFGLVIAEAMACGRALVASQAGGAAEIISAGVSALGHTPGDAASLAQCIERLAVDSSLRAEMGRAGRERAKQYFDRLRLATDLIPIYREAIAMVN